VSAHVAVISLAETYDDVAVTVVLVVDNLTIFGLENEF